MNRAACRILSLIVALALAACAGQAGRPTLPSAPVIATSQPTVLLPTPTPAATPAPTATPALTPTPSDPQARPIAMVNGEPVTMKEFAVGFPAYRKSLGFPPDTAQLRSQFLERLVAEKLLNQEIHRRGLDNDPEFVARLSEARRKVIEEALSRDGKSHGAAPDETEARAYYQQHIAQFSQPEVIRVRNITTDTRDAAAQARARIVRGETFADVAGAVSIHPSRANGGTLPPLSRGTYDKAFEDKAFGLRLGELSDVFQTDLGWHVVEKTGETPARTVPFESVKTQITNSLAQQNGQGSLDKLGKTLRSSADVRILANP